MRGLEKRLEGKVAIVTGDGRGLGRAISRRPAAEGASVAVVTLHEETASAAAAEIERAVGRAIAVAGDVASEDATVPARWRRDEPQLSACLGGCPA